MGPRGLFVIKFIQQRRRAATGTDSRSQKALLPREYLQRRGKEEGKAGVCNALFVAIAFTVAERWKQHNCPLMEPAHARTHTHIKIICIYLHTMESHSADLGTRCMEAS